MPPVRSRSHGLPGSWEPGERANESLEDVPIALRCAFLASVRWGPNSLRMLSGASTTQNGYPGPFVVKLTTPRPWPLR